MTELEWWQSYDYKLLFPSPFKPPGRLVRFPDPWPRLLVLCFEPLPKIDPPETLR